MLSFVLDFDNVRIYYVDEEQGSMNSSFLDGSDRVRFRTNVANPHYRGGESLAYCNKVGSSFVSYFL